MRLAGTAEGRVNMATRKSVCNFRVDNLFDFWDITACFVERCAIYP